MSNWHKLQFDVPIKESIMDNNTFLIKGIAISETTTRNGVTYLAEELEPSAETLRNKPILKDHENSVDSIVGKTTDNVFFDSMTKNIQFEGMIKDSKIQEKINDGLINSVSVGAMVKEIEEVGDGDDHRVIARGIDFVELSLVAVPADKNATFTRAVAESFNIKNKTKDIQIDNQQEEKSKMAEENVEIQELKATNDEQAKELDVFRAEKTARDAEELEQLQHEYKEIAKSLSIEARNTEGVSSDTLLVLIEDLKKVSEQEEAEAEAEEEAEAEAEEESEAEAEEESEAEAEEETKEEKMTGKISNEKEKVEDVVEEFVFTTEDVSTGHGLYKAEFDNPKYKR